MQIEKANETGFCFGVRQALKILDEAIHEHGDIETLGYMVHNQKVIDNFSKRGARVVKNIDQIKGNVVVIPSHGVPPLVREELNTRGLKIIDATCPTVRKAQMAAKELSERGFEVIVFGDPAHSEVKGVLGWVGDGIATLDSTVASQYDKPPYRLGFLSQTTQNPTNFLQFVGSFVSPILPQINELCVINTICHITRRRQSAGLELARRVDLMIVVGGRNSANTERLAEICSSTGVETHHIEEAAEIEEEWLKGRSRIGITTGTSTLDEITQEVVLKLEKIKRS